MIAVKLLNLYFLVMMAGVVTSARYGSLVGSKFSEFSSSSHIHKNGLKLRNFRALNSMPTNVNRKYWS